MCVAYPGQVLEISGGMALVDTQGRTWRASTMLIPETAVGDWVVVGAGTVLQILDADEARAIRELLDEALRDESEMRPLNGLPAGGIGR